MARTHHGGWGPKVKDAGKKDQGTCPAVPATPTGLVGAYDRAEAARHNRIRLPTRWTEVHEDVDGFPINLRHYIEEWQYSANDEDWYDAGRATVSPKQDDDDNSKAHHVVKKINPKLAYRFRVMAVARDGCKSGWSEWEELGTPGAEEPPAPSDVTIFATSLNRVVGDWDAPTEGDDPDVLDQKVQHFQAALMKNTTDAPTTLASAYKFDRFVHVTKHSFRVPDPAEGHQFYLWARSVGETSMSLWIPATYDGNSDPFATPDPASIGKGGGDFRKSFTKPGVLRVRDYEEMWTLDRDVTFTKALCRVGKHDSSTHPADGCPTGSAVKIQLTKWDADESDSVNLFDSDDRLTVSAGTHRDVNFVEDFDETSGLAGESVQVRVRAVGSNYPGKHLNVELIGDLA